MGERPGGKFPRGYGVDSALFSPARSTLVQPVVGSSRFHSRVPSLPPALRAGEGGNIQVNGCGSAVPVLFLNVGTATRTRWGTVLEPRNPFAGISGWPRTH